MRILLLFCMVVLAFVQPAFASPKELAKQFGQYPSVERMALSPNGTKIAYIMNRDSKRFLVAANVDTFESIASLKVEDYFVNNINWTNEETLILDTRLSSNSEAMRSGRSSRAFYAVHLKSKRIVPLLQHKSGYNRQYANGSVDGIDESGNFAFIPGFEMKDSGMSFYNLMKVSLSHGRGTTQAYADPQTFDFIVTPKGDVVGRSNFNDTSDILKFEVPGDTLDWKTVFSEKASVPTCSLIAVTPDYENLVMSCDSFSSYGAGIRMLNIADGKVSDRMTLPSGHAVNWIVRDINKVMIAGVSSSTGGEYEFVDPDVQADYKAFRSKFGPESIELVSWSGDNMERLLFHIEVGMGGSGRYVLLDRTDGSIKGIAASHSGVPNAQLGRVHTVEYKAADGLDIEGILTWPPGANIGEKHPLIVFPHGGPAAHDSVRYDYMAQYMANLGYLVFQPNFRGSTGYGYQFTRAGDGEWGQKMQTDLSDGITALVQRGWADADDVCIVGWSYGGYAAMAGIAFQPDVYKCAVAGAGVSDLNAMMESEDENYHTDSWVMDYWRRVIAKDSTSRARIGQFSPVNAADQIKAPLLLIHGTKDTVVDPEQSEIMYKALKKLDKDVELLKLKNEDHSLSQLDARIDALTAIGEFLNKHLPVE